MFCNVRKGRISAPGLRPEKGQGWPDRGSGEVDSAAARLILQDYLDGERTPGPRRAPQEQESR